MKDFNLQGYLRNNKLLMESEGQSDSIMVAAKLIGRGNQTEGDINIGIEKIGDGKLKIYIEDYGASGIEMSEDELKEKLSNEKQIMFVRIMGKDIYLNHVANEIKKFLGGGADMQAEADMKAQENLEDQIIDVIEKFMNKGSYDFELSDFLTVIIDKLEDPELNVRSRSEIDGNQRGFMEFEGAINSTIEQFGSGLSDEEIKALLLRVKKDLDSAGENF